MTYIAEIPGVSLLADGNECQCPSCDPERALWIELRTAWDLERWQWRRGMKDPAEALYYGESEFDIVRAGVRAEQLSRKWRRADRRLKRWLAKL